MTLFQSILLGILQGLTEFIPVSSTAHLLLGQTLLGISPSPAMFSFTVIVQLGTLVSLFAFYRKDLLLILRAAIHAARSILTTPRQTWNLPPEALLGWYLLLATLPALLAGYLLKDAVEALFAQPLLQASIRLFTAAVLLTLAEWLTKKNRRLDSMTPLDALIIGCFQILAVLPGASRSGTTISGGMFRGFDRPSAARFAFLMSVPVMLAAGVYEMLDVLAMPALSTFLPLLAAGFLAAAVSGWFAVKWLIAYLNRHSLYLFAVYCAVLALITLTLHLA
jgi:undecaprenyl-diphosphatase